MANYIITNDPDYSSEGAGESAIILGDENKKYFSYTVDEDTLMLTLKRIDYEKHMYRPGYMKLTFSQKSNLPLGTVNNILKDFVAESFFFDFNLKLKEGYNEIAHGYYCYSARLQNTVSYVENDDGTKLATANYRVVMECYSKDQKLTLFPSCNAWTGKKFKKDIIPDLLSKYNLANEYVFDSSRALTFLAPLPENKEDDANENGEGTTPPAEGGTTPPANGSSTPKTDDKEIPMPYLVQYNESPYDFMCRVANRCGEFMYNEEGKMCIGLKKDVINGISKEINTDTLEEQLAAITETDSEKKKAKEAEVKKAFEWQKAHTVSDDDAFIQFGNNVYSEYSPNVELFSNEGYPFPEEKDKDNKKIVHTAYNASYTQDSYGLVPEQDDFEWAPEFWMAISAFGAFFSGESLIECVNELVNSGIDDAYYQYSRNAAYRETKENFFDKYKDNLGGLEEASKNIINETFANIEDRERIATEGKVTLDFQNSHTHNFHLGDNVYVTQLGETWNIVTDIYGYLSKETNDSPSAHYVDVIPVFDEEDGVIGRIIPPLDSRPRIRKACPQEAIVVDASDPLMLGRVRVRFLWQEATTTTNDDGDTVDDAKVGSPWIRMTTPFAGGEEDGGGFFMMPETGSHVMVNFMHDNMELPYVDGALYFKDFSPKENDDDEKDYSAPDAGFVDNHKRFYKPDFKRRVLASGTGSSLSFIDGESTCNFFAGVLPVVGLLNNIDCLKSNIPDQSLEGNIILRDTNGVNEINMNTTGRTISIESPIGKVEINAFTGISIEAPNGDITIKGKNVNIEAGNNISIKSGKNIQDKGFMDNLKESIGAGIGGFIGGLGANVINAVLLQEANLNFTKTLDVQFLRSVMEVIVRPVEGTLAIQSKGNVVMTAGEGKVTVPTSNMSKATKFSINGSLNPVKWTSTPFNKTDNATDKEYKKYVNLRNAIKFIGAEYTLRYNAIVKATSDLLALDNKQQLGEVPEVVNPNLVRLYNEFYDADDNARLSIVSEFAREIGFTNNNTALKIHKVTTVINVPSPAYQNLEHDQKVLATSKATTLVVGINEISNTLAKYIKAVGMSNTLTVNVDSIKMSDVLNDIYNGYPDLAEVSFDKIQNINTLPISDKKLDVLNAILKANLKDLGLKAGVEYNGNNWNDFVESIDEPDENQLKAGLKEFGIEMLNGLTGLDIDTDDWSNSWGKLVNWNGQAGPRALWEAGRKGGIFMSNNKGATYVMDKNGRSMFAVANPGVDRLKQVLQDIDQAITPAVVNKANNLETFFYGDGNVAKNSIQYSDDDNI